MEKISSALIVILYFFFCVSCTDTVSPVLTGSISGFVNLYEENGTQITDRAGVKVYIEGRNNFAYTNNDGRYVLENVEAGIFNIVFEKEGFGIEKIIAREFVGGGNAYIYDIGLAKLPSFNVTSLNIATDPNSFPYIIMNGNVSDAQNYYRIVVVFFGKSEEVSNDPQKYLYVTSFNVNPDSSSFRYSVWDKQYLIQRGFNSGETVHVAAYSSSEYWGIYDPITGREFFYNVGTSPVKSSFILD